MQEFSKCNKIHGIYWLKRSLEDIIIRIKLKFKEDIISLPKFEDFKEKSDEENLNILDSNKVETYDLKWQEKVFSSWEIQKYSYIYNCTTETEKKYHEMITKSNCESSKIFTYINEDYHLPVPVGKMTRKPDIRYLSVCFALLKLDEKIEAHKDVSSSMGHLFKSEDDISHEEQWMAMHVALDTSEYNEDSQLLFKQECILLSIFYNVTDQYLLLSPDVNDLEFNPYCIEDADGTVSKTRQLREYSIEIEFQEKANTEELEELLHNLYKKWKKKQKNILNFVMPPLGKKKFFLTLEIVSAIEFEMDNLYIEYHIKIPDDLQYNGEISGRTHVSKKMYVDEKSVWMYGHIMELELECATGINPSPLKIFLEAISTDWWGRYNTQGYSCLALTLEAGEQIVYLSCSRPEELDSTVAESRRFFVGGCHLLKDLDVLDNPQTQDANFRYVSTGTISLRWQIVSQTHAAAAPPLQPHTSASALLKGAEAVLRQYRKAKATLAAATENIAN
ncbi:unnamed protein product, partial [Brenthis ino]